MVAPTEEAWRRTWERLDEPPKQKAERLIELVAASDQWPATLWEQLSPADGGRVVADDAVGRGVCVHSAKIAE